MLPMAAIHLQCVVQAPPELCFDLSLSVRLHLEAAAATGERVIGGSEDGLLQLGDEITWEARHLGLRRRLKTRVSEYERPVYFRDEMVCGPFRSMTHDHHFVVSTDGTVMMDDFEFVSGFPVFDRVILLPHLRRFLAHRNTVIRDVAESGSWREYLDV